MRHLLVLACLIASACAPTYEKPGASQADFKRDYYECIRDARGANQGGDLMSTAISMRMKRMCMEAKGWEQI